MYGRKKTRKHRNIKFSQKHQNSITTRRKLTGKYTQIKKSDNAVAVISILFFLYAVKIIVDWKRKFKERILLVERTLTAQVYIIWRRLSVAVWKHRKQER